MGRSDRPSSNSWSVSENMGIVISPWVLSADWEFLWFPLELTAALQLEPRTLMSTIEH